jgi:hypothetical protein
VHASVPISDDEVRWRFSLWLFYRQSRQIPFFDKETTIQLSV